MAFVKNAAAAASAMKNKKEVNESPFTLAGATKPAAPGGITSASQLSPSATQPGSSGASRFVNFDRVLGANLPGATGMAQKTLTETAERGQKAEKSVQKLGEKFGQKVKQGTQTYTGTPIGQTGNQAYEGFKLMNTDPMQGVDPNAGTISLAEAQQRATQGYTGPEMSAFFAAPEYAQAQQDVQKAAEATKAMGSESGLEALLNQMYGTAGGTGGSRLDMALAKVAGGPAFDTTRARFGNIDSLLSSAAQQAGQQVTEGQTTSADAQALWQDAVNRKLKDIEEYEKFKNQPPEEKPSRRIVATDVSSEPASKFTTQGTGNQILVGPYEDGSYRDESGRRVNASGNPI